MSVPRLVRIPLLCWCIALFLAFSLVAVSAPSSPACADRPIPSYYSQLRYNLASPGARATSIGGYANPAFYGMLPGGEAWFSWTDEDSLSNWGLFLGAPHIGFGVVRSDIPLGGGETAGVNDYRFALSGGSKTAALGLGYGWSGGDGDRVGRSRMIQAGVAHRLGRRVSLGLAGNFATEKSFQSGFFDLAVRPFGDQALALFGDLELPKGVGLSDAPWSLGAMVDLGPGLQLTGRFFDDESYAFSVGYSFDVLGFFGSPQFSPDDRHSHTVWQARIGYPQRNILNEGDHRENSPNQ